MSQIGRGFREPTSWADDGSARKEPVIDRTRFMNRVLPRRA